MKKPYKFDGKLFAKNDDDEIVPANWFGSVKIISMVGVDDDKISKDIQDPHKGAWFLFQWKASGLPISRNIRKTDFTVSNKFGVFDGEDFFLIRDKDVLGENDLDAEELHLNQRDKELLEIATKDWMSKGCVEGLYPPPTWIPAEGHPVPLPKWIPLTDSAFTTDNNTFPDSWSTT